MWNYYADHFNSVGYTGSDGSDPWYETPWIERGDDGQAGSGTITVEQDYCPDIFEQCVEIDTRTANVALERPLDLSAATSASIGFSYRLSGKSESVQVAFEVSKDGGASWSAALGTVVDNGNDYAWFDLTPYVAAGTRIRFRVVDADPNAHFYVDNLEVWYKSTTVARDEFVNANYANSQGAENWTGAWTETGDNNAANSGSITVENDSGCPDGWGRCVEMDAAGGAGDALTREINLSNAFSAVLSFSSALTLLPTMSMIRSCGVLSLMPPAWISRPSRKTVTESEMANTSSSRCET